LETQRSDRETRREIFEDRSLFEKRVRKEKFQKRRERFGERIQKKDIQREKLEEFRRENIQTGEEAKEKESIEEREIGRERDIVCSSE
jgi:hypothetical protein